MNIPISVCLVTGGATLAGLKAGPKRCSYIIKSVLLQNKSIKMNVRWALTFLYAFTDTVRLLEEVVVVSLAASIQEVFALSHILVVVPPWEGAFTGSHNWSSSTWV